MKKQTLFLLIAAIVIISVSIVSADDLSDVRQAGVIRFGHVPDYAPFVYSDPAGNLTGIDIALMEEAAGRLGLRIQSVPLPRDKMIEALKGNQVDVIGGAFAVNEERAQLIDYTNAYYHADDLFVCLKAYYQPTQVTLYNFYKAKIGVEKGSDFEQWIRTNLVKGKYVQQSDVYAYASLKDAMKALDVAAVNLVMMDKDSYLSLYEKTGKYKIFYDNFLSEDYAFGIRKGSALKHALDSQLSSMFNDGTAQRIANRFFEIDLNEPPMIIRPTQNTQAAQTPDEIVLITKPTEIQTVQQNIIPTAAGCTNEMTFIADVSESNSSVEPGGRFRRRWQFKNTGTCTWNKDYRFDLANGTNMGTNGIIFPGECAPGGYFEIYLDLIAPTVPGFYNAAYQMRSPQGVLFGQMCPLNLIVK